MISSGVKTSERPEQGQNTRRSLTLDIFYDMLNPIGTMYDIHVYIIYLQLP